MKKIISLFVLIFISTINFSMNAQIASTKTLDDVYKKVGSHTNLFFNTYEIRYAVDRGYYICIYTANQFEDGCVVFNLGKDKDTAIQTIVLLTEYMKKATKDNPITLTDTSGNKIEIHKLCGECYFNQDGIAKGTSGYCTNNFKPNFIKKATEDIKKFNEQVN